MDSQNNTAQRTKAKRVVQKEFEETEKEARKAAREAKKATKEVVQ